VFCHEYKQNQKGEAMWAIKWFFAVILILAVMGFALQNSTQTVDVTFVKNVWQYQSVQLWMVIYVSFGLGVLFWLVVSVFQVLELKSEIRTLNRSHNDMINELDSLRNLPIAEDDVGLEIKEET